MEKCKTCYLRKAKPCYECSACISGDDHYKYWPNTHTNADRIRSMSDEELAELLEGEYGNFETGCALEWLGQPAEG